MQVKEVDPMQTPPGDERQRQPMDPTRKLLKVFGVKVTDYEERTNALLERWAATSTSGGADERTALLAEAMELTSDLDRWLREINNHVLQRQEEVLRRLSAR
jgi:hypothetical protein